MRIIAGEKKGLHLLGPSKKDKTRPSLDQIKEAVFNVLQPIKENAFVLDLFAGTGQIGLEFLSRGAGHCVFVEKSPKMAAILRQNIEITKYEDRTKVYLGDFRTNLKKISDSFDYIYLDPPYYFNYEKKTFEFISSKEKLNPGGIVILEAAIDDHFSEEMEAFEMIFKRKYNYQCIRIYKEIGE